MHFVKFLPPFLGMIWSLVRYVEQSLYKFFPQNLSPYEKNFLEKRPFSPLFLWGRRHHERVSKNKTESKKN